MMSGMMSGGWFILIILVIIIYFIFDFTGSTDKSKDSRNEALKVLNERYAKGELNDEEYLKMKRMIQK